MNALCVTVREGMWGPRGRSVGGTDGVMRGVSSGRRYMLGWVSEWCACACV